MTEDIIEPFCIAPAYVDGLAGIRIDRAGVARVNLFAEQLGADGQIERLLVARLTMSREVMREIADRMLTETMVASHRGERATAELRAKMD